MGGLSRLIQRFLTEYPVDSHPTFQYASTPIEHTLRAWIGFYQVNRGVGHTTAAVNGVAKTKALLVCHNSQFAKSVGTKTLVYSRTDSLQGLRTSVVWDNAALIDVFIKSERRIGTLKGEIEQLETQRRVLLDENYRLKAQIVQQQEPLYKRISRRIKKTWKRWYVKVRITLRDLFSHGMIPR